MAKEKKRLSKNAKAALKAITDSKLLAAAKAAHDAGSGGEFKSSVVTPRTTVANKLRPEKKRG
ncbi:MAG: hypothetical protein KA746_02615 [Pyrinomonadaceae bacterium]|nr:hypothetical protein [Pyrinomonadaceae bacterium]MBP6212358.1 hypothetical protein [Pyrinomonadaceae bacterium]